MNPVQHIDAALVICGSACLLGSLSAVVAAIEYEKPTTIRLAVGLLITTTAFFVGAALTFTGAA